MANAKKAGRATGGGKRLVVYLGPGGFEPVLGPEDSGEGASFGAVCLVDAAGATVFCS